MDGSAPTDPGHTDWPSISDYWPDKPAGGHLVTPGLLRDAAGEEAKSSPEFDAPIPDEAPSWDRDTEGYDALDDDDDVPAPPGLSVIGAEPPESRLWKPILAVVAAFAFLGGSGLVLAHLVTSRDEPAAAPPPEQAPAGRQDDLPPDPATPNPPVSIAPAPTTPPSPAAPTTPPNPSAATFELVSNTTAINVSLRRLDDGLFRLSTPDGSGVEPRAELSGGTLRVTVDRTGRKGSGQVDVVLDDRTTWSIRMTGGVRRAAFDLSRAGSVPRIDFAGGAREIDLALPPLRRTVPIRMTGGVHDWTIRTAGEVPVRAQLRDGAGLVVLNGDRERGVRKGSTLTARARDAEAGGRLEVDAVAGVGTLKVRPA